MRLEAIWKGDVEQAYRFQAAIEANCACETVGGKVTGACAAHQAMFNQRFLDGILFSRWLAARLESEEWRCDEDRTPSSTD